jgi:energy-coupling factor transporter transmembrane protein EcfT
VALTPQKKRRNKGWDAPLRGPVPYAYRAGNSFLHRLGGGWKLLALFLIATLAFALGPPFLAAGTLLVAAGSLAAGMRPWELLRGVKPLLVMALLVTLCRTLAVETHGGTPVFPNRRGFAEGLIFGWGIILAFCAASLFFSVTTMTEIKESLDKLRLRRLSLGLSLMLGFLPRFFAVWQNTALAYRARCGKRGLPQLIALVPLAMERMILSAAETATALEARGCRIAPHAKPITKARTAPEGPGRQVFRRFFLRRIWRRSVE